MKYLFASEEYNPTRVKGLSSALQSESALNHDFHGKVGETTGTCC